MALLDFVPVTLFFTGSFLVGKDLKKQMNIASRILYCTGIFFVTAAGTLKALYKLIYAIGVGDIKFMNGQFFPNEAFGFLFAGAGLLISLGKEKKRQNTTYALLPTGALVGMIIVGMGAMYAVLCKHASRLGKPLVIVLYVVSFFLSVFMGYLSSHDFDSALMNWIAQAINTVSQICFFAGCMILHKNGLGEKETISISDMVTESVLQ